MIYRAGARVVVWKRPFWKNWLAVLRQERRCDALGNGVRPLRFPVKGIAPDFLETKQALLKRAEFEKIALATQ